jgi:hypothetical protein
MLTKKRLGKHKTLRRMDLKYMLLVETVIILEAGIFCISIGSHNRILFPPTHCIWCPSPHFRKRKHCLRNWLCCSNEGCRRHQFTSYEVKWLLFLQCSSIFRWNENSTCPLPFHLKTKTERSRERWVLFWILCIGQTEETGNTKRNVPSSEHFKTETVLLLGR